MRWRLTDLELRCSITTKTTKATKKTTTKAAKTAKTTKKETVKDTVLKGPLLGEKLKSFVTKSLEDDKAEDIIAIDLAPHSALADYMFIATGRSGRQVNAIANHLMERLKAAGATYIRSEGLQQGDWVILDTGDVIVHIFKPEVRTFYNIEGIWSSEMLESYSDTLKTAP